MCHFTLRVLLAGDISPPLRGFHFDTDISITPIRQCFSLYNTVGHCVTRVIEMFTPVFVIASHHNSSIENHIYCISRVNIPRRYLDAPTGSIVEVTFKKTRLLLTRNFGCYTRCRNVSSVTGMHPCILKVRATLSRPVTLCQHSRIVKRPLELHLA